MMRLEGLYVKFAKEINVEANSRLHALCNKLLKNLIEGITDLIPGYVNLYVEFDAAVVNRSSVRAWIRKHLERLEITTSSREVIVPTRYDGEDLAWVASQTNLSAQEITERHSQRTYRVYMIGFAPGQPLMGTLDHALYVPRRSTPRKKVRANAVAIAVSQTTIYSLPTPGGWHLLGTALRAAYNPHREEPFLFAPGDSVRFVPSEGEAPKEVEPLELLPTEPHLPVFRVEEAGLLDLLLDTGRFFGARFGLARSGWVDARSARLANAVVGNKANESLLELTLKGPVLTVLRDTVVGFAGFGMQCLLDEEKTPGATSVAVRAGQRLSFKPSSSGARAYVSVAGGFEVKEFMGSSSVDVQGRIGRALRAGDVLGLARVYHSRPGFSLRSPVLPERVRVRLLAGPQATGEALEALCKGEFTVTSLDRMGVRLEGSQVPGGELISEATLMGAVQITTQGNPIILLNDRGGIGGYAKPAVVHPSDLWLLAQLRPGQKLGFTKPSETKTQPWVVPADRKIS
jgi:KipI family sensor histidine kinase inhibitor